jgi:hypothetical protein
LVKGRNNITIFWITNQVAITTLFVADIPVDAQQGARWYAGIEPSSVAMGETTLVSGHGKPYVEWNRMNHPVGQAPERSNLDQPHAKAK